MRWVTGTYVRPYLLLTIRLYHHSQMLTQFVVQICLQQYLPQEIAGLRAFPLTTLILFLPESGLLDVVVMLGSFLKRFNLQSLFDEEITVNKHVE